MSMRGQYAGQSLAEYGLIIALVSLLAIGGVMVLGQNIVGQLTAMASGTTSGGGGSGSGPQLSALPPGFGSSSAPSAPAGGSYSGGATAPPPSSGGSGDPVLNTPASPPQVSGSRGDSQLIYANSQQLMTMADKYAYTNPSVSDFLKQLARKGEEMSTAISNGEYKNNNMLHAEFLDIWLQGYEMSNTFKNLSSADKVQVQNFANNIATSSWDGFMNHDGNGSGSGYGDVPGLQDHFVP